jgi:hypothetical protein
MRLCVVFSAQCAKRIANRLLASAFSAWEARWRLMQRVRTLMDVMLGRRSLELFTRCEACVRRAGSVLKGGGALSCLFLPAR